MANVIMLQVLNLVFLFTVIKSLMAKSGGAAPNIFKEL